MSDQKDKNETRKPSYSFMRDRHDKIHQEHHKKIKARQDLRQTLSDWRCTYSNVEKAKVTNLQRIVCAYDYPDEGDPAFRDNKTEFLNEAQEMKEIMFPSRKTAEPDMPFIDANRRGQPICRAAA